MPDDEAKPIDTQTSEGTPLVTTDMVDAEEEAASFVLPSKDDLPADEPEDDAGDGEAEDEGDADPKPDDKPEAAAQEPVEYVEDPGEFTAAEHSFEVTLYDEKGGSPRNVTVKSLEEWDALLEKEPNLGSSAAVGKAFRAASKMEREIETEREAWQTKKAEYDKAVQAQATEAATVELWVKEMDYLAAQGELPPISEDLANANWNDPKVAKQPAVAARIEVLHYMRDENLQRAKLGLPRMTSMLDAYQGFARQKEKAASIAARRDVALKRKEAGSKVAGSAPAPAAPAPRGVSVGRVVSLD